MSPKSRATLFTLVLVTFLLLPPKEGALSQEPLVAKLSVPQDLTVGAAVPKAESFGSVLEKLSVGSVSFATQNQPAWLPAPSQTQHWFELELLRLAL